MGLVNFIMALNSMIHLPAPPVDSDDGLWNDEAYFDNDDGLWHDEIYFDSDNGLWNDDIYF